MDTQHFETLRTMFGNHTRVAERLGLHPVHWRYVRRTGKVSRPVQELIRYILEDKQHKGGGNGRT